MISLPPVCILAGGMGTRLGGRVRDVPKPLIEVAGQPFLLHQLRLLAREGAQEIVICVGYLGELVEATVGPERYGIRIRYSYDGPGLDGTLGAVRRARGLLGERFLVLYGDTYLRLDYRAAAEAWERSGAPAMMTVLRNEGRWDASNAVVVDGWVQRYAKGASSAEMVWIDYGLGGLTAPTLDRLPQARDLSDLYASLAAGSELLAVTVKDRFYEIGGPRSLAETEAFLRSLEGVSG